MLTGEHFQRFNDACIELYRANLTLESYAGRAFSFLSRLVPTELIAFGSLDRATQQLSIGFNSSVSQREQALDAFGRVMWNYELFCWDPSVNAGRPFCRSDYFSSRQFQDLDVFSEVYRLLGIDNHCALHVPAGPDEIAFFGLERKGGPDFTVEERTLLELGQSQLGNARELARSHRGWADGTVSAAELTRAGLTPREADVLAWLSEGKSNEEIAMLLGLQLYTVKGYVKAIFQKTGAPNRLAAALWALRIGRQMESRKQRAEPAMVRVAANRGALSAAAAHRRPGVGRR